MNTTMVDRRQSPAIRFGDDALTLTRATRHLGLVVPGFRSPPRVEGVRRTIQHHEDGGYMVAVVVRDRPWGEVQNDMIEGVIAGNSLVGARAAQVRRHLTESLGDQGATGE